MGRLQYSISRTPQIRSWVSFVFHSSYSVAERLKLCHTLLVMAERSSFVILRYEDGVPWMASCAQCQHKFFTPVIFSRDLLRAKHYLLEKFDLHQCKEEPFPIVFRPADRVEKPTSESHPAPTLEPIAQSPVNTPFAA
jgi:hypothetical protein